MQTVSILALVLAGALPPPVPPLTSPAEPEAVLETRLEHAGIPLEGPTRVKLVISRGASVLWSNDGSGSFELQPEGSVPVEVHAGSLRLALGRPPMRPLPAGLLDDPDTLALHLWVEVDGHFLRAPGILPVGRSAERSRDAIAPLLVDPDRGAGELESEEEREREREGRRPESPDERQRQRRLQRLDDRGALRLDALLRAKRHLDAMPLLAPGAGISGDAGLWSWSWLGPGNVGGRLRAILTHPTQPDTLWIGTAGGGIWKTTNGGASWSPVDDFLPSLAVCSLAMKRGNPSVLYAGTGEGFGNLDALPGAGIFRSLDGGVTWSQLASTDPAIDPRWSHVNRITTVPGLPDWLFAACSQSGSNGTLFRSTDGGATWQTLITSSGVISDVDTHPSLSFYVVAGGANGVWTSLSAGDPGSWQGQATGAPGKLPLDTGRCEITVAGSSTVRTYVSCDRNKGEVWLSEDGGSTWTLQSTGLQYLGGQGWYNNAIWADPTDSTRIVVGGIDLYRSLNKGVTLQRISDWRYYHLAINTSAHGDQHAIVPHSAYDGVGGKTVFFGNDGGIQKAADVWTVAPTSGWTKLTNGLGITQFYRGAALPDGSVVLGGTQDNDTVRYTPAGGTGAWFQSTTGDGGACAIDWLTPNLAYGEWQTLVVRRSLDGGATWTEATSNLGDTDDCCKALFIAPMEMDPNDPTQLLAGGTSIWKGACGAFVLWSSLRGPVTDGTWASSKCAGCSNTSNPRCSAIAIAKGNSNVIWVGYESGRVSRTLDGGSNWTNVDTGLPNRWVTDIAIHPWDPNQVLVTFGGYQQQSLWYTPDGGQTWVDRTGTAPNDLPPVQLNTVTFHPAQPSWIYVGTDLGVLASEDLGVTWSKLPLVPGAGTEGPVNTEVADLFWQGGSSLVAATHGRGMYRATPYAVLYVDKAYSGVERGTFEQPFKTVAAAQAAALPGTVVAIKGGTYLEAPRVFDLSGALHAVGGVVVIR